MRKSGTSSVSLLISPRKRNSFPRSSSTSTRPLRSEKLSISSPSESMLFSQFGKGIPGYSHGTSFSNTEHEPDEELTLPGNFYTFKRNASSTGIVRNQPH